jgi:hypothetical protein
VRWALPHQQSDIRALAVDQTVEGEREVCVFCGEQQFVPLRCGDQQRDASAWPQHAPQLWQGVDGRGMS